MTMERYEGFEPDPMPVLVLRADDALAAGTITQYLVLCEAKNCFDRSNQVTQALEQFRLWQERNPEKVKLPRHRHVPVRSGDEPANEPLVAAAARERVRDFYDQVPTADQARIALGVDAPDVRDLGVHRLADLLGLEPVRLPGAGEDPRPFLSWAAKAIERLAGMAGRHEAEVQRILRLMGEQSTVDSEHAFDAAAPARGRDTPKAVAGPEEPR